MSPRARKGPDTSTLKGRFAARLTELREKRKLSIDESAEALGVTVKTWYSWEAGKSVPDLELWAQLSDLLDCSLRSLLPIN